MEIIRGHVSKDHVHLFASVPPHVDPSQLMQRIKGKTSRKRLMQFKHLKQQSWGRHVWARGFFAASSGNVTDEVIMKYIETQGTETPDDDFRVDQDHAGTAVSPKHTG